MQTSVMMLKPAMVFMCVDLPAISSVVHGICSSAVLYCLEDAKMCRRAADVLERILATWHFWTGLVLLFADCQTPGLCLIGLSGMAGILCLQPWNSSSRCWSPEADEKPLRERWPSQEFSEELRRYGSTCTICLEDYQDTDNVSLLPCGHLFHNTCINAWYQVRGTCPLRCHLDASGTPQASRREASSEDDSEGDLEAIPMEAAAELTWRPRTQALFRASVMRVGTRETPGDDHRENITDMEVRSPAEVSAGETQTSSMLASCSWPVDAMGFSQSMEQDDEGNQPVSV